MKQKNNASEKGKEDTKISVRKKLFSTANDIIESEDILSKFSAELRLRGVVGDLTNHLIVFLAFVSRLLAKPLSIVLKGSTCGGKSDAVDVVMPFLPKSAFYLVTAMSKKAILHSNESFEHRIIVFNEAGGVSSETLEFVKVLLTQGYIKYSVTVPKEGGGFGTIEIEKKGPTGLITTTTAIQLDAEIETRVLSLAALEGKDQTKAIMGSQAEAAQEGEDDAPVPIGWNAFQEWLALGPTKVIVPFAQVLADLIPAAALRMRRDFPAVLSSVKSHALMHRYSRKRQNGAIVATIAKDYRAIWKLEKEVISVGVEATVTPQTREFVTAVRKLKKTGITVTHTALANELGVDKATICRHLKVAAAGGFVENLVRKDGVSSNIVLRDPLPEDIDVLPTPNEVLRLYKAQKKSGQLPTPKKTFVRKPGSR
jgi:hypothetical protein